MLLSWFICYFMYHLSKSEDTETVSMSVILGEFYFYFQCLESNNSALQLTATSILRLYLYFSSKISQWIKD